AEAQVGEIEHQEHHPDDRDVVRLEHDRDKLRECAFLMHGSIELLMVRKAYQPGLALSTRGWSERSAADEIRDEVPDTLPLATCRTGNPAATQPCPEHGRRGGADHRRDADRRS